VRISKSSTLYFLVLVVAIGVAGILQAQPGSEIYQEWYSDATFTTSVGWHYHGCGGQNQWEGTTSDYVYVDASNCNSGQSLITECGGNFICSGGFYPPGSYEDCACG
jgi:hypothetical protein